MRTVGLIFAIALLCSSAVAGATTIQGAALDTLAAQADEIVVGEVVSVEAFTRDGRVSTRVLIAAEQCYVGAPVSTVEIVVPGGRDGDYATWVPGADEYAIGEQVLVFLEALPSGAYVSRALAHSKFTLTDGADGVRATRDPAGLHLVTPTAVVAPDIDRNVFTMDELEALILQAVEAR